MQQYRRSNPRRTALADMIRITARQPNWSEEQSGSGLTGVRQLRDELHRRRRARRPNQDILSWEAVAYETEAAQSPRDPRVSRRQVRRIEDTHAYLCAKVDPIMDSLILALISDRPENVSEAALNHLLSKKKERIESRNIDGDLMIDKDGSNGKATVESEMGASSSQKPHTNGDDKSRDDGDPSSGAQRQVGRHDRLFMAREVGPLVTALIHRALCCMPVDVEDFLIEELQSINVLAYRNEEFSRQGLFDPRRPSRPSVEAHEIHISHLHIGSKKRSNGYDDQDYQSYQQQWLTRRPSSARNRLQQAKSLDQHVQQTSPPLSARTEEREPPGLLRPESMQGDIPSDESQPFSEALFGGRSAEACGVKESRNKPWDVEVSSTASNLPTETPSSGACEARANKAAQVAVVLLLGLDGAGKTTLLGTLQGEKDPRVRPSVGFKPVTMMLGDQLKVKFYDLGGGKKIRNIWDKYYHDAHALLYVVDGADGTRWEETKELFLAATSHKYLRGKPVAVILNKDDTGLRISSSVVVEELGLSARGDAQVCICSVNAARAKGGVFDERLEGAVEWLLGSVKGRFAELNQRVQRDKIDMEREFQLEKERQQLDVMRGLLRKTFAKDEMVAREDCFDESEGLEFLASELGLATGDLPADGAEVAALVGYQKLALQMVGDMKSPISRKNRARTWEEIREVVVHLRRESGIDR